MSTSYHTPGVYVAEIPAGPRPIQAVGTSTAVFIGDAPLDERFRQPGPGGQQLVGVPQAIHAGPQPQEHAALECGLRVLRQRRHTLLHRQYGRRRRPRRRARCRRRGGRDRDRRGSRADRPREPRCAAQPLRTARGPGCNPRHARGGRRHRASHAGRDGAGSGAEKEVGRRRRTARGGCRGRRPAARRTPSAPDGPRLRGRLLPMDHRDGPDRRHARQCSAVGSHGRHLGSHRRHPRRAQGAGERERQRSAQPDVPPDARRAGRAERRRRELPAPLRDRRGSASGVHARSPTPPASGGTSTFAGSST